MYLDLHAVTNHTNVQRHSVECDLSIMHLSALKIAVVKKFPKKYDTRFYGSQAVSLAVVAWKPWQTMVWCRFWWLGRTHVSVGGQATINPKCLKCTVTHHVALAKKHLIGLSSVRTSRPFWSWTQMVGVWQWNTTRWLARTEHKGMHIWAVRLGFNEDVMMCQCQHISCCVLDSRCFWIMTRICGQLSNNKLLLRSESSTQLVVQDGLILDFSFQNCKQTKYMWL